MKLNSPGFSVFFLGFSFIFFKRSFIDLSCEIPNINKNNHNEGYANLACYPPINLQFKNFGNSIEFLKSFHNLQDSVTTNHYKS